MQGSKRVLASIEERGGLLLTRVYADRGEEFELVDCSVSTAQASPNLAGSGGPALAVARANDTRRGRPRLAIAKR